MKNNIRTAFPRAAIFVAMTAEMAILGVAKPASAITLSQYQFMVAEAQFQSALYQAGQGGLNPTQEAKSIASSDKQYMAEQKAADVSTVGQATLGGEYPSEILNTGDTSTLNFLWVSTDTGLPTVGQTVTEVDYYISTDPTNPTNYIFIGSSTDAADNFPLPYTGLSSEAELQALPIGLDGPIVITGLDGYNVAGGYVAALLPEPSSWLLMCIGATMIALLKWQKSRKA